MEQNICELLQKDDMEMVLRLHEAKGWLGLLGSLDVMQWEWKNCPKAHRGAFQGKDGVATVALEAAVDCRLWFWHAWFGMPGANNNLNILDCSIFPGFDNWKDSCCY